MAKKGNSNIPVINPTGGIGGIPNVQMGALFSLSCDHCGVIGARVDTDELLAEAERRGIVGDDRIQRFALEGLRQQVYQQLGWTSRGSEPNTRDYCAKCVRDGKVPGDDERKPGAGVRSQAPRLRR